MEFREQSVARRVVYAALSLYALAALVVALIPLLTIGIFPNLSGSPLEMQMKIARVTQTITTARYAALGAGALATMAFGVWVFRAHGNLEALGGDSGLFNRWVAALLCVIPGLNVISGPVVVHRLLATSEERAGERAEWFRFAGWQLVAAWVVTVVVSLGTFGYAMYTFSRIERPSEVAGIFMLNIVVRGFDIVLAGITAMIVHRVGQLQAEAAETRDVSQVFE